DQADPRRGVGPWVQDCAHDQALARLGFSEQLYRARTMIPGWDLIGVLEPAARAGVVRSLRAASRPDKVAPARARVRSSPGIAASGTLPAEEITRMLPPGNRAARRIVLLAAWIGGSVPGRLAAQGLEYVQAHYTKYEYRIPMRDGKRLFTSVY